MRFNYLAVAGALAAVASALSTPSTHVVHEKRGAAPKNWVKLSKVNSEAKLPMRIGLKQSNLDNGVGETLMHEVYVQ